MLSMVLFPQWLDIWGHIENPCYEEVSTGTTGHAEVVEILYDPQKISYKELLEVFWRNIDPTTPNQQFADKGSQYRTAIFYHNEEQKKLAEQSKADLEKSGKFDKPIVTEIVKLPAFIRPKTTIRITTKRILFIMRCTNRAPEELRLWNGYGKQSIDLCRRKADHLKRHFMELRKKRCIICEGGVPPLDEEAENDLLKSLTDWKINRKTHIVLLRR